MVYFKYSECTFSSRSTAVYIVLYTEGTDEEPVLFSRSAGHTADRSTDQKIFVQSESVDDKEEEENKEHQIFTLNLKCSLVRGLFVPVSLVTLKHAKDNAV